MQSSPLFAIYFLSAGCGDVNMIVLLYLRNITAISACAPPCSKLAEVPQNLPQCRHPSSLPVGSICYVALISPPFNVLDCIGELCHFANGARVQPAAS